MVRESKREQKPSSPATSPYFDSQQRCQKYLALFQEGDRSHFFLHAPSSTFGSIQSLGPLIYTWIGNDMNATAATEFCHRPKQTKSLRSSKTFSSCSSCKAAIDSALLPFLPCPTFRKKYFMNNDKLENNNSSSCIEITGKGMEENVRHLCSNRCFYRAFCPARDWVALRKALHEQTDECIDCMLGGWTCKLVIQQNGTEKEQEGQSKLNRSHTKPPRTLFFNAVDQKCYSYIDALKLLTTKESTTSSKCQCRHYEQFPLPESIGTSKKDDNNRISLESPLGLLEEFFGESPWQLLMCTIMLNRTQRIQVDHILFAFLERWSTPEATLKGDIDEICALITPLGIKGRRSRGILRFCKEYLQLRSSKSDKKNSEFKFTRNEILGLYHCGDYAADAYQIFIQKDWKHLHPKDHALRAYVEWKRSKIIE